MADTPAITQLRNLLGQDLRIEVTDGRVITGMFGCIDKEKNIILRDSMEEQVIQLPGEGLWFLFFVCFVFVLIVYV